MAGEPLRDLAERLRAACTKAGITIVTAESCTGGLVSDAITDVPGSSDYFLAGIVSYSNPAKERLLDVPHSLLEAHGAVSAQVARAMATGARERSGALVAASVTGIAGPSGGSAEKPVGLTYVAVADPDGVEVQRHVWQGNRLENKEASARAVLELLVSRCEALAKP